MIGCRLISSLWECAVISVRLAHVRRLLTGGVKTLVAGRSVGSGRCTAALWSLISAGAQQDDTDRLQHPVSTETHWRFGGLPPPSLVLARCLASLTVDGFGLPGGGVSGVRGLMRDNWFSAAPCRDAGQQNSWNLENVKNKPSRSGFICRSASKKSWNEKLLFLFSFCFQCPKRALPGKSHGLKCQIAWGSGGWSWWSRVATAQKHKKSAFNRKKKKEQTLNQC